MRVISGWGDIIIMMNKKWKDKGVIKVAKIWIYSIKCGEKVIE
jgi:hypothetical protein